MISVIIVNHNYGMYIGKAIESVINQTYLDYEIIVIDGASTDNSRKVIMQYVEKYPDVITAVFKPTSGQAAAFNLGYKISCGDIISFLDADDYFLENKLEVIAEEHKTHKFIGHDRTFHDPYTGKYISTKMPLDDSSVRIKLLREYGYIYTYNIITSCISLTRDLAAKIFPMPEKDYVTFADCYVKVMAQYFTNIYFISRPLTYYRIHKMQETQSFDCNKSLNLFVMDLYNRVFNDINNALKQMGEDMIPKLTDDKLGEALKIANPHMEISFGKKYVIYGVGNNSFKIKRYVELMGGIFILATDSNRSKVGQSWEGLEILDPEKLMDIREKYDKIIIGSSYFEEITEYLNKLGFECGKDFTGFLSIPND